MREKGFKIPEDYWESSRKRLYDIPQEESGSKPESKRSIYLWLGLAAAGVSLILYLSWPGLEPSLDYQDLDPQLVSEYLSEDPYAVYPESFLSLQDSVDQEAMEHLELENIEEYLENIPYEYL